MQVRTKKSQLAELRHEMLRENAFPALSFNNRDDFVLDELPCRLTNQFFFVV